MNLMLKRSVPDTCTNVPGERRYGPAAAFKGTIGGLSSFSDVEQHSGEEKRGVIGHNRRSGNPFTFSFTFPFTFNVVTFNGSTKGLSCSF